METTLVKGLEVIEALSASDQARGVSSLATELSLTKSNVHRLLQTLVAKGYVRRNDPDATYQLCSKVWEMGLRVRARFKLDKIAGPAMMELAAATGESVHLSVLSKLEVIYMDKIESDQAVRSYTTIGGRAPAWCVATGKAMLAACGLDAKDFGPLKGFTKNTITDPAELNAEFRKIRQKGFAVNRGEWREDVNGVASAVMDGAGDMVAGIGVSGPQSRFKQKQMKLWSELVVEKANDISRELGGKV